MSLQCGGQLGRYNPFPMILVYRPLNSGQFFKESLVVFNLISIAVHSPNSILRVTFFTSVN
jgi:hypothetical protein